MTVMNGSISGEETNGGSYKKVTRRVAILGSSLLSVFAGWAPGAAVAATRLPRVATFANERILPPVLAATPASSTARREDLGSLTEPGPRTLDATSGPTLPASGRHPAYHIEQFRADVARLRHRSIAPTSLPAPPQVQSPSTLFPTPERLPMWFFPFWGLRNPEVALLASNSVDTGSSLDIPQIPVGKVVIPQLPPLGDPGNYLPESPDLFNGYVWPSRGTVTSGYGMRWGRLHQGIDIAAPVGTPIIAASSGEVIKAGWGGGYGKLVKLKHHDGSVTLYAHSSRLFVRNGQQVRQGQQIAAVGNTGRSTGPHLHFEIHPKGKGAANPIAYLPKRQ